MYIYVYYINIYILIYNVYGAASQDPAGGWSWSFLPLRLSTLSSFPSPPCGLWWWFVVVFPPPLWPVVVGCGGGVYVYMICYLFMYVYIYMYTNEKYKYVYM